MLHGDLKLQFDGKIVPGAGRGRRIGIPTINIATACDVGLAHGIYFCMVEMPPHIGGEYYGAMHFGPRPTFGDPVPMCEIHLVELARFRTGEARFFTSLRARAVRSHVLDLPSLTGEYVRVYVFDYLRPVVACENVEELKRYVEADIVRVRELIGG